MSGVCTTGSGIWLSGCFRSRLLSAAVQVFSMAAVAAQGLTGEGALHVPFWLLEAGEGLQASASSWLLIVLPSSLSSVHYHVSVSLGKLLTQKLMGVSKQEGRGTGKPDYWLVDTDLQSDITPCLPCSVD